MNSLLIVSLCSLLNGIVHKCEKFELIYGSEIECLESAYNYNTSFSIPKLFLGDKPRPYMKVMNEPAMCIDDTSFVEGIRNGPRN